MKITKDEEKVDVEVLPFWEGKDGAESAAPSTSYAKEYAFPVHSRDFTGKQGEALFLYTSKEKRLLLLGLGEKSSCSLESLRCVAAALVKACRLKKLESLSLPLPKVKGISSQEVCFALTEGALLANYVFNTLKRETAKEQLPLKIFSFLDVGKEEMAAAERAVKIAAAVNMARDLVNGNADEITPKTLCKQAQELAKSSNMKITLLGKKELEKEKMGLLLAVGRAATSDPALIILEYRGAPKSQEKTALIGKGVTFDTGGLNLKQTGQMETMRCDMAGAATVLGTLKAARMLSLKVNLIGVIATAENAVGPLSYKPGDVYVSHSGKSVEISNTDAEGRLILADALSYVQTHYAPTRMIDLATLTGGILIAFGHEVTGLFSNDDTLAAKLHAAGEKTFERLWRFPLYKEFQTLLKSSVADIKNSGGRQASSITAALFLQSFILKKIPWAHLDIAGTAFLSDPKTYHPTCATGVGVRLLIEFLSRETE